MMNRNTLVIRTRMLRIGIRQGEETQLKNFNCFRSTKS